MSNFWWKWSNWTSSNKKVNKNKVFKKNKYLIFGILNLTPDSFSDGGDFIQHSKSIQHAKYMYDNGANYIDVGGCLLYTSPSPRDLH